MGRSAQTCGLSGQLVMSSGLASQLSSSLIAIPLPFLYLSIALGNPPIVVYKTVCLLKRLLSQPISENLLIV